MLLQAHVGWYRPGVVHCTHNLVYLLRALLVTKPLPVCSRNDRMTSLRRIHLVLGFINFIPEPSRG